MSHSNLGNSLGSQGRGSSKVKYGCLRASDADSRFSGHMVNIRDRKSKQKVLICLLAGNIDLRPFGGLPMLVYETCGYICRYFES